MVAPFDASAGEISLITNNGQCWKNGERILPNDISFVARCITITSTRNKSNPPKQSTVNNKRKSSGDSKVNLQPEKTLTPEEQTELFFRENKKKPGVLTTGSGLQLEVLKEGKGSGPKRSDKVKVLASKTYRR
ncbi:FKBP-type peptidyl-prolyl cis-trans isomerase N-terminal domain-containing protein [Sphingobacterium siyangense]|uniref:FKBP-type peptidyl-prolyl cis-trans isomerase N-terminal domain-containing protein n=1 Tax=Sphingobacterium siyangense TaxID=459529 RepID=UPI003DA39578